MADPIPPERLAEASLLVAAWPDGTAHLSLADGLDDAAVAAYLRTVADLVEAGHHRTECEACRDHLPHEHPPSE